jgi:hypothetical protein
VKHDISDLAEPNFWAAPLLVFYNRDDDDATGHLAAPNGFIHHDDTTDTTF